MVDVITSNNRYKYAPLLDQMHRDRKTVFVDRLKWDIPVVDGQFEIDQFDTDAAVYLLGLGPQGEVTSGVRLMPTTGPHLMRDVFSHTVTLGQVPCDPRVYEITRYFVWGEMRGDERRKAVTEVFCGLFEYAVARNLTQISVVCDTFFLPRLIEAGWKVHHLGLPTEYAEGVCAAILLEVSPQRLADVRARAGLGTRTLTFSSFPPPNADRDDDAVAA